MAGEQMALEKQRLEFTKEEMKELLVRNERVFAGLVQKYQDEPRLLENMMTLYGTRIRNIKTGLGKPYFARIDFERNGAAEEPLYIGKVGLFDRNNRILITDWRAPVSSLYYNSNLGHCAYEAPEGRIEGELLLKRQILIEDGKLESIFDVDAVSDDELLRPYLGASADNRLKNIVASIQKEQNDIIRKPLKDTVIVQGVAGSGKTTVALHRIAYLVYNYSKQYKAEQFMVIGPNKFFINYISGVLPDLDVGNAEQLTYEELAAEFVAEPFGIQDPTEKLTSLLQGEKPEEFLSFKTSMEYKTALDTFFAEFEAGFLNEAGLTVNGFPVVPKAVVMERCRTFTAEDLATRLQMTAQALTAQLQNDGTLRARIKEHFDGIAAETPAHERELFSRRTDTIKQQENGFSKELKKYLNLNTVKVLALYKRFVENIERYTQQDGAMLARLKKETLKGISKRKIGFEDIPAILYLKLRLFGNGKFSKYVHTVVDEAQDFGVFHFYVLKRLMNKCTFSIFGDLTQGIYSYRSVGSWEQVQAQVFEDGCTIMQLEKSYRTTIEIMDAANRISRYLQLPEGKPVIRHGSPVAVSRLGADMGARVGRIAGLLEEYKKKGYQSIALISKTAETGMAVCDGLRERGISPELISEDKESYQGGLCALTCYLAKGLEFDAVILCDADAAVYAADSVLDMKLLYVAMTRALHQLELLCTDSLPEPLLGLPG